MMFNTSQPEVEYPPADYQSENAINGGAKLLDISLLSA
jgi:hypothetical protein